jgi:hypothetical protein
MHKRLETTLFYQIVSFYFMIFMSDLQKRRPGFGAISATVAACPFAGGAPFQMALAYINPQKTADISSHNTCPACPACHHKRFSPTRYCADRPFPKVLR